MHHKGGDGDRPQVFREVRLGECLDAVVLSLRPAQHCLAPPVLPDRLRKLAPVTVVAIEGHGKSPVEPSPAGSELRAEIVENINGQSIWIGLALDHLRWHGTDKDELGYSAGPVPSHISGRLTASGRVANMDGITQVEERRKRGDVLGIG